MVRLTTAIALALAAGRALATRPEDMDGAVQALSQEKQSVCYLMKNIKLDGVGHQLFSMLSVMAAHGMVDDEGMCYVYDARPREFEIDHMEEGTQAWKEATALLTGFYSDFSSAVGPRGCASPELMKTMPTGSKPVNRMPLLLGDICKENKFTTWQLDNLWYGADGKAFMHRQLMSKPGAFMQAVIQNSSALAALAAHHLPRMDGPPPLMAVHMRFGDRAKNLLPMAEGQQLLFQNSEFKSVVSKFPSTTVFTDTPDMAKSYLTDEVAANVEFCGPNCSSALQAIARMVNAEVFVGTTSDLSSVVALMRIGLHKKNTYMASSWQWAHGFEAEQLSIYKVADHHQENCHAECDDNPNGGSDHSGLCYWCGRHQTDQGLKWMRCCDADTDYPAGHNCHGAAFASGLGGQRQCVMQAENIL